MASEVSREVGAAVRWLIVGIALGVLPTYVLLSERAKKETASASSAAASAAAASVYAAWSATPPVVCPAQPITLPTVVAVTGNGNGAGTAPQRPTRVGATAAPAGNEVDESQMMMPMLNMMQGMMQDGTGTPSAAGSGMPDMTQLMKSMPK
jgi:hypothetical protein